MKVIIAGSRTLTKPIHVRHAIEKSGFNITTLISGHAKGVDRLGENWASFRRIHIVYFLPKWGKYGRSAGFKRNEEMAKKADALIAVWDGKSRDTKHMILTAKRENLKIFILKCKPDHTLYS